MKIRQSLFSAPGAQLTIFALSIAAAAPLSAQQRMIEEVIVTSQKTEQSLQDVPISVSAVTGDQLRQANIQTLSELAVQLPNVNFATDGQQNNQVYIRGFGTNPFNPSFESSVGLVQDEIFYGRGTYFREVPFDIERVEVLRGPQGTLFGKNTVAGVFSLTSRAVPEDPELYLEAGGAENGGQKLEVAAGAMLTDSLGLRVSALRTQTDGQLYNSFLERHEENPDYRAQRIKLLWQPHDAVDVELLAMSSKADSSNWPLQLWQLDEGTRDYLQDFDPDIEDDPLDNNTSMNHPGEINTDTYTYALKTTVDFGPALGLNDLLMTVVAARTENKLDTDADLDTSPSDMASMFANDEYLQDTLEWRFSGSADGLFGLGQGLDFVGGLYYFQSDFIFHGGFAQGEDTTDFILTEDAAQLAGDLAIAIPALYAATLTQSNQRYDLNFDRQTESLGLFGQFTWHLTDTLSLTPGLRINRETKQADVVGTLSCDQLLPAPCTFGLILGANSYELRDQERTADDFSPKLALMYAPSEELNFYASVSQGFKSGGYNAMSFTGEQLTFDDEQARSIEIGAKGRFFDRGLSVNLALFQTNFEDLQVLAFNGVFYDVRNAATATSRGLELDWQWLTPWPALSVRGALGLLDSTYDDYPGAPAPYGDDGLDGERNLAGEKVAYAPESSLTVSPMLEIPLGDQHGIQTVLDIIYTGEKYSDTDLDPNTLIEANTKYNLRVSLGRVDQTWSFSLGVKNLGDEKTLNLVTDAPFFPGTYYTQQSPRREVYGAFRLDL